MIDENKVNAAADILVSLSMSMFGLWFSSEIFTQLIPAFEHADLLNLIRSFWSEWLSLLGRLWLSRVNTWTGTW